MAIARLLLADRDRLSSFYRISNHKNFIPKYIHNALNLLNTEAAIGGKSSREPFWKKFPVLRNTAASEIGSSINSLLQQLRCNCNPNHNKFSSFSYTAVVVIFFKSLLMAIDPENNYRAPLTDDDYHGSKTLLKRNLRPFKLHLVYLDPFNLSNVGFFLELNSKGLYPGATR